MSGCRRWHAVLTIGLGILLSDGRNLAAEEKAAPAAAPAYVPVKLDEAEARKLQSDWADRLGTTRETETAGGIRMVLIPPSGEAIPRPYWIGKYEVMNREWQAVQGAGSEATGQADQKKGKESETGRQPVGWVTLLDCMRFCNRLSEKEGFKPYYSLVNAQKDPGMDSIVAGQYEILGGDGYRLPLPAEFEHAMRAGTVTPFFFGDASKAEDYGWFKSNSDDRAHDVGLKLPNPWGLHDVHGNVREWVERCQVDPQTKLVSRAQCFGCAYNYKPFVSGEGRWHGVDRLHFVGMRLARNATPALGK